MGVRGSKRPHVLDGYLCLLLPSSSIFSFVGKCTYVEGEELRREGESKRAERKANINFLPLEFVCSLFFLLQLPIWLLFSMEFEKRNR